MTSYYSLLNKIEAFCDAHLQIKKYAGEFREQMPNFCTLDEKYPVVFVAPNGSLNTLNQKEFTLDIYCVDVIQKDRANLNVILSDTELILNDLYLYFSDGDDWTIDVLSAPSLQPVNNFDLDYVAGWFMTITFQVEGYCVEAIPMEPIIPGEGECENASVQNSDASYVELVASGGSLTLPDTNIKIVDENDNILWNADYPSVQDQVIQVDCPDCADATIEIKKAGDGTIASLTLPCGTNTIYDVADNIISVNGNVETTIDATDPLNVILEDENGATINPTSIVYHGNHHHLHLTLPSPIGALPLKSGQTISYATGDDGDIEAGRDVDFLTLPFNNPFGNTDRFTDEFGGQVYNNKIAIDWSTYGNNRVLGYYMLPALNNTWLVSIVQSLALNVGGFINWRMANVKEVENVLFYRGGINHGLDYPPFNSNFTSSVSLWSSTTDISNTANAYYFVTSINVRSIIDKTAAGAKSLSVRTFNVSGTSLT